ncbi:hypothetical protein [uncultured Algibacter sp.]|uniref:hypothetical protein n=1 Tax=uncultured Algibacter sp. TaxID=298659 RepID=UPI0026205831|nr:hypothetical protein [uncultured Algibacter sp.]
MAGIAIVIILVLGWIIYEQSSAKKNRTEREQKFENIESERKEKYKENPIFLKNVLKMNSTFELLTSTEIENLEIDYTSGEDYQSHQLKKSIFLNYYGTPFSLSLLASQIECKCFITTKSNNNIFIDLELNANEQNDKTVNFILKELERLSGN